jgi:Tat protein secretion system quality control protein TatD with DNase activity
MDLIDIGINLTHESYDSDREAVIARAAAVQAQVLPAVPQRMRSQRPI